MDPITLRIKFEAFLVYQALYHLRPTNFPILCPTNVPHHRYHQLIPQQSPNSSTLAFLHFPENSKLIFTPEFLHQYSHCLKCSTCQHGSLIIQVSLCSNVTSDKLYLASYLKETPKLPPPHSILSYYFLHSTLTISEIVLFISLLSTSQNINSISRDFILLSAQSLDLV